MLELQKVWAAAGPDTSSRALALTLRASAAAVEDIRRRLPVIQIVWTGPGVDGSYLRATREVVREIIRDARSELLLVGYWIVARDDGDGIIAEVIALLADAVKRGVHVSVVLDERVRSDSRDNRSILVSAWPHGVPLPTIQTWRLSGHDEHLKLHAKVLVADRRDALVTSANLTSHAMDLNMEMGTRLTGTPAHAIARHFDLLVSTGVLESYGAVGAP